MFYENFKRFTRDELGAITVDFVTLTAVIVGFGMGVMIIVTPGIQKVTSGIEPVIQSADGLAGRLINAGD